jgi:hypothetical protein
VGERPYFVDTPCVSIIQYFHTLLDYLEGFLLCEGVFVAFDGFSEQGLGNIRPVSRGKR